MPSAARAPRGSGPRPVIDDRPLRIALTADPELPVPPPLYGGIERVVDLLAHELEAQGHEVTLFAHPDSSTAGRLRAWPGATSTSARDSWRNAWFLRDHVLTDRIDVVHSFSRVAYLLPLFRRRAPMLMTYQRHIARRSVALGTSMSGGALWFSAISEQMMHAVRDVGTWRMVPNAVSVARYTFVPRVADDAPLVFLGRVEEIKGPHLAIEIALRSGRRLVIAGNIPAAHQSWADAHVLRHVDGERVRYVGAVDDAAKDALLGSAAALLMPIQWEEPFGIVMIEAMACGTPVLALARGAAPEVVQHGVTGVVAETIDALVEGVARLGSIDRAACRHRVEQRYSPTVVAAAYLAIYREMLATRTPEATWRPSA